MADGYGFAGEGDWKTAALVRAIEGDGKWSEGWHVIHGKEYTYHLCAR